MRSTLCRWGVMCTLLLSGCAQESAGPDPAASVNVKVTRAALLDDTFVTAETGTLRNDGSGTSARTIFTVAARRGRGESSESPLVQAVLNLRDGSHVACSMRAAMTWSDDNDLVNLDLRCAKKVVLADVADVALQD